MPSTSFELGREHPNSPSFAALCEGCERGACICDAEERCGDCREYHKPSEDCPAEVSFTTHRPSQDCPAEATIEEQFIGLLHRHGLSSLSLHATRYSHGDSFLAYAHCDRLCTSCHGDDAASAIAGAIKEMNEKRATYVEVPKLALLREAA